MIQNIFQSVLYAQLYSSSTVLNIKNRCCTNTAKQQWAISTSHSETSLETLSRHKCQCLL